MTSNAEEDLGHVVVFVCLEGRSWWELRCGHLQELLADVPGVEEDSFGPREGVMVDLHGKLAG
eukprot:CAMPEP_0202844900 /NCGR_PEP_ID=MMETSP1389-20130828/68523_1 /ASSEMBLY_ACC=CAM_ASM_000865 /TAXON_ID=302021 /ORGANISM="Rhodomonas sp., Strain CCMP768" /LENGTH=62 /DNA_ID=CAMNT_0049522267 /DNA_START=202 /DNA_END=390 /DNA_ORIENTATION=+